MKKKRIAVILCAALCCALFSGCGKTAEVTRSADTGAAAATEAVTAYAAADMSDAAKLIEDITTNQAFTNEPVAEADITAIVNAGMNAPSSMNGQPWHFSVITDTAVLEQIAGDMSFGGAPSGGRPSSGEKPAEAPEGVDMSNLPAGFTAPEGSAKPEGGSTPSDGTSAPSMPTASGSAKAGIADAPLAIVVSCKSGSELDAGLATQNMSAEAQLLGYGSKIISSTTMALNGSKQAEYRQLLGIPEEMSAVCVLLIGRADAAAYDAVTGATTRNDAADMVTYIK